MQSLTQKVIDMSTEAVKYRQDIKQAEKVNTDGLNYLSEGLNWFNQFLAIEKGKMRLSYRNGAHIHHVAVYNPDIYYEPVYKKKHYEFRVEFSADSLNDNRHWMACFIGARISSLNAGESNPNLKKEELYASFSERPSAYVYCGVDSNWPHGTVGVSLDKGFAETRTLSVMDSGNYITYSVDGSKVFTAELIDSEMKIYNSKDRLLFSAENDMYTKKGGYFRIFNHFADTIVSGITIIEHDIEKGTQEILFKDGFKYFDYSNQFKAVSFPQDTRFNINGTIYNVHKNQIALISPYDIHTDLKLYNIKSLLQFDENSLRNYFSPEHVNELTKVFQSKKISIPPHELVKYTELCNVLKKQPTMVYLRLAEILHALNEGCTADTETTEKESEVSHIVEYIDKNYEFIESLDSIAKHFYVSRSHLCRMFKKATGMTVVTYLNEVRITNACKMLADTDYSITDVYIKCGFNYSSYFANVFKKVTGQTPTEFKESIKR